jgi:hypothetical protein
MLNSMWVVKTPIGVCLKQRYFEYEISIAFEGTSATDEMWTRADLRIYKGEKDVTNEIMDQHELMGGNPDDVLWNPNMIEMAQLFKTLDFMKGENMIARSRLMLGSVEAVFDTSATDEVLSGVDKVEIRLHVLDQAHKAASKLKTPLRRVDLKNRNGNLQIDIYGDQPEVLRGIDFIFPH